MPSFPHSMQSRVGRSSGLMPQLRTQQPTQQQRTKSLQQFGDRDLMLMVGLANVNTKQGSQQQKVGDFALARAVGGFDTKFQDSDIRNTLTLDNAGKNGINTREGVQSDSMKAMMRGREFAAIAHDFDGDGQGVFLIKNVSDDLNNPDLRLFMMDNGVPTEMDTHDMPLEDLMGKGGRLVFGNKIETPQTSPSSFTGGRTLDVLNRFLGDPKISKNQLAETAVNHYSQMPQQTKDLANIKEESLFHRNGVDPTSETVVSDPGVVQRMVQKRAQQQGKIAPSFDRIPSQQGGLDQIQQDVARMASKTENAAKVLVTGFDPKTRQSQSFVFTRNQDQEWVRFDGSNEVKQSPKEFLEQTFGLKPRQGPTTPQLTETSLVSVGNKTPTLSPTRHDSFDEEMDVLTLSPTVTPKQNRMTNHMDLLERQESLLDDLEHQTQDLIDQNSVLKDEFDEMSQFSLSRDRSESDLLQEFEDISTPKHHRRQNVEIDLEQQLQKLGDPIKEESHDEVSRPKHRRDNAVPNLDTVLKTTSKHRSPSFSDSLISPQIMKQMDLVGDRGTVPNLERRKAVDFSASGRKLGLKSRSSRPIKSTRSQRRHLSKQLQLTQQEQLKTIGNAPRLRKLSRVNVLAILKQERGVSESKLNLAQTKITTSRLEIQAATTKLSLKARELKKSNRALANALKSQKEVIVTPLGKMTRAVALQTLKTNRKLQSTLEGSVVRLKAKDKDLRLLNREINGHTSKRNHSLLQAWDLTQTKLQDWQDEKPIYKLEL